MTFSFLSSGFEKVVGLKGFILLLFTITYIILTQFELSIKAAVVTLALVYLIGAVLNLEVKEAERKYLLKKLLQRG